jgi:hypothetical protein
MEEFSSRAVHKRRGVLFCNTGPRGNTDKVDDPALTHNNNTTQQQQQEQEQQQQQEHTTTKGENNERNLRSKPATHNHII